ncbi:hypothetical protein [Burkholderia vietnamiensis]|uniref:hypothetical protein n=1 Tax=Burkholderia vietnamiensis TaxID=60552 RepID=UPI000B198F25|nr:hypothetical protein [Burkholderia vietnamiensis]
MTGPVLKFTSRFEYNTICILDGLRPDEAQTGLNLYNDLRDVIAAGADVAVSYARVANAGELRSELDKIEQSVGNGAKPIVHIECHGDVEGGLAVGEQQDRLSWSALELLLRRINIACSCNLGVVMAVCHGMHAISPIRIGRPTPFYFLLGSQDALTAGTLRAEMPKFYETLLETNNLDLALACAPSCKPFHADRLFAQSFGRYLRHACMGKGKRERVERALSVANWTRGPMNREERRRLRTQAKVRFNAEAHGAEFDRMARVFLSGRRPSFTFDDLLQWVRMGTQRGTCRPN